MKTFGGSMGLILLAVAAGCRRSETPPPQTRRPPPPLMRALNETAFEPLTADKTNHVYRLICNRTFHEPFCVVLRVEPDSAGLLTRKMLSSRGGYNFGSIKEQQDAAV